jgi:thymidylate synthase
MKINPNQLPSFSTPGAAWRWGCDLITKFGRPVTTEDGQKTKEIRNLMLQIDNPLIGWPIDGSGWDIPALEVYYNKEIILGVNTTDFDYTYGARLRSPIDQVQVMIEKLRANPSTRRAIGVTWHIFTDNDQAFHPPCLIFIEFLIRGEALHMSAFFRSWDVAQAAPQNIYGLARLMEYVAGNLDVEVGTMTITAASAHIYQV